MSVGEGAIHQLTERSDFQQEYFTADELYNRNSKAIYTQPFNGNNRIIITREADLCRPIRILCNNMSDGFYISKINLTIGGQILYTIDTDFLMSIIPDFISNIFIDGCHYKVYNLDRTSLFTTINMLCVQYMEVALSIETYGTCDSIDLQSEYTYLDCDKRRSLSTYNNGNYIDDKFTTLSTGLVSGFRNDNIVSIVADGCINGIILSGINYTRLNKIRLYLSSNMHLRIALDGKLSIYTNITVINDFAIYIPLNEVGMLDDITPSSLNTSVQDAIYLELGLDNEYMEGMGSIDFNIGFFSKNILRYSFDMATVRFLHRHDINCDVLDAIPVIE